MKRTILLKIAIIFSLPLAIVAIVTFFLFNPRVSGLVYRLNIIPPDPYGFTITEREVYSFKITSAMQQSRSEPELATTLKARIPEITQEEIQHLIDVWLVLNWIQRAGMVSIILVGLGIVCWGQKKYRTHLISAVHFGALATLILITGMGTLTLINWNNSFIYFHEVLFSPGTYSFPANSLLIRLYPVALWQLAAGVFAIISLGISGLLYLMTRKFLTPSNPKNTA